MKFLRLLGLTVMAVLAVGAVASATASAESVEILSKLPATFKSTQVNNKNILETAGGGKVECEEAKSEGTFTKVNLGTASLHFLKCKSLGVACKTTGDAEGTLLFTNLDVHLVDVLLPKEVLGLGIVFKLPTTLVIECGKIKIEVRGSVIGEFVRKSQYRGELLNTDVV